MNYDYLMIHFGELSTKGSNKRLFVNTLIHNVRLALKKFDAKVTSTRDHIFVDLTEKDPKPIIERLQEISGIQRISLVYKCGKDIEEIKAAGLALMEKEEGRTFKIKTHRVDKKYPLSSYEISCEVADSILDHFPNLTVDLHEPDIVLSINLGEEASYLCCHDYPGLGGYPLGMNGKVLLLLSGGIDSPVAAYELLRRGIKIETIHFASPPYTQMAVIDKLKDLLAALNLYQNDIRLDVVPFTKLQEAIYEHVDEPYCITIMRRMMLRIAVLTAKKHHCLALATGESIGQVASQTLESLQVINEVTNFPILRPLATQDKLSIISTAKRIGTYDISIRPYEDCCTIFKPKKPKTKPRLDECEYYESKFDWKSLVEQCVEGLEPIFLSGGEEVFSKKEESK